jgi:FHS family L-fucose permease-like MFS transporter
LHRFPAAKLIERIGYQRALTTGLMIMTIGSLGMILAAYLVSYGITVASLFVVSCGIALLQVAANPYVAVIGPAQSAETRLTLVQAFNTTGDVLAILFGKYLILARTTGGTSAQSTQLTHAQRMADAQATELPYLIVAAVLAVLAILIARAKLPALGATTAASLGRGAPRPFAVPPPQPDPRLCWHCTVCSRGDRCRQLFHQLCLTAEASPT